MIYIFWQNVISIHQSAFIKALSETEKVILVAEQELDKQRRDENWEIPSMGEARTIIAPSDDEIKRLIDMKDSQHIFSGINAFPIVYKAFRIAVKNHKRVSVFVEPYEWNGLKGKMRALMYRILFARFGKYIQNLFVTGHKGFECYNKIGFPKSRIHQWGYFTENVIQNKESSSLLNSNIKPSLIYVGRIDENKNIMSLLHNIHEFDEDIDKFTIVGDGPLMNELVELSSYHDKIKVLGRQNNKLTQSLIRQHDFLVLPSLYDGWGAVVNEALSVGTRVLCSEACGASILLDGKVRGGVFSQHKMIDIIKQWILTGKTTEDVRGSIIEWAYRSISGHSSAKYFLQIIRGEKVEAPWI